MRHTTDPVDALMLTVALTVLAHVLTVAPLVRRHARWHVGEPAGNGERAPEPTEVGHHLWR